MVIYGNQYHILTQQSFLEAAASLSNSSRDKSINTTERSTGSKCSLQQNFHRHISAQHSWLLRSRPTDLSSSFLHSQCPKQWYSFTALTTLKSLNQLPDIYLDCLIFFQKCHFWVISDIQWWKQISTHFSDSTHQECIIFARTGHGPCYYHWNEIFAGVKQSFYKEKNCFFIHHSKPFTFILCPTLSMQINMIIWKFFVLTEWHLFRGNTKWYLLYSVSLTEFLL